MGSKDLRSS
uniref:Uncharacterized protein n=1 Tax=Rhizophora mucronata TaxID=61149 RepID=A0A2P2Q8S2_RHIMU